MACHDCGRSGEAVDVIRRVMNESAVYLAGDDARAANFAQSLGRVACEVEAFEAARFFLIKAHETLASRLGPDHVETLDALDEITSLLRQEGDLEGAIRRQTQALEAVTAAAITSYGPTRTRNNLGILYQCASRFEEAEKTFRMAMEQLREDTASSEELRLTVLNNLASQRTSRNSANTGTRRSGFGRGNWPCWNPCG